MLPDKLRQLRQERGFSLRQLAEAADVSPGLLSQVERGKTDPSLATIRKLAAVYGADLATLFAEPEAPQVHISRPNERPTLSVVPGAITYERLTPGRTDLEVLLGRLRPGEQTAAEPWAHASTECAYVTRGALVIVVNDDRHPLNCGESITFNARMPHHYVNEGKTEAEFLVAVTPPMP